MQYKNTTKYKKKKILIQIIQLKVLQKYEKNHSNCTNKNPILIPLGLTAASGLTNLGQSIQPMVDGGSVQETCLTV